MIMVNDTHFCYEFDTYFGSFISLTQWWHDKDDHTNKYVGLLCYFVF